jgi:ribosome-binding ATPase YchF (GTP1/OBG family)
MLLPEIHEFLEILYSRENWTEEQIEDLQDSIMEKTKQQMIVQHKREKAADIYNRNFSQIKSPLKK